MKCICTEKTIEHSTDHHYSVLADIPCLCSIAAPTEVNLYRKKHYLAGVYIIDRQLSVSV